MREEITSEITWLDSDFVYADLMSMTGRPSVMPLLPGPSSSRDDAAFSIPILYMERGRWSCARCHKNTPRAC